jgi:hypothetical protein
MYRTDESRFDRLLVDPQMFSDHLPNAYELALSNVLANLEGAEVLHEAKSSLTLFGMIKYGVLACLVVFVVHRVVKSERGKPNGAFGDGFWRQVLPKFSELARDIRKAVADDFRWTLGLPLSTVY